MQSIKGQSNRRNNPVGIASEVRSYFESNRVSPKQASVILGVTPSAVSVYLAGRPFSEKTAGKWAEAFGFSRDFLAHGKGALIPEATKDNKYPRTERLTAAQTALIARGYNFMRKEKPDEKDVPFAAIMNSTYQVVTRKPAVDDSIINVGDIYKWQDEALKAMREQMTKVEERLLSIESIVGQAIGLGADTVSALPTSAISSLLLNASRKD